jgi:hypothetical protein
MRAVTGTALTKTVLAKTVLAVALVASLASLSATVASAEGQLTRRSDAQKKEDEDVDKAYRAATKGEVEPVVKKDPWRTVRPADADKTKR